MWPPLAVKLVVGNERPLLRRTDAAALLLALMRTCNFGIILDAQL